MEDEIGLFVGANLHILVERPGIARQILVRPELCRIDEDGYDDETGLRARRPDQARMARMQGAHGRHEPDALASRPCGRNVATRLLDSCRDGRGHKVVPFVGDGASVAKARDAGTVTYD